MFDPVISVTIPSPPFVLPLGAVEVPDPPAPPPPPPPAPEPNPPAPKTPAKKQDKELAKKQDKNVQNPDMKILTDSMADIKNHLRYIEDNKKSYSER